jgi:hypothetical protein
VRHSYPAVFLTLYGGDAIATDAPALGPFDDLVIRSARVVGGPQASERVVAFRGSDGRWLEAAEQERRGVASDSPYARHSHLRLHSPDHDLMVRFFAEDTDAAPAKAGRELGPFFAVTVGPRELRADGELLADRGSAESAWATHQITTPLGQSRGGSVLAVRSGGVAFAGEDARVAPRDLIVMQTSTGSAEVATAAEAPAPPAFRFIERVRVDPKIYRARGTVSERDP